MRIDYAVPDWTDGLYRDEGSVRLCARPWQMVHETKADSAVLLCHGFSGYPGELIRPGKDLYERGLDCFCPRYPGHGTTGRDFVHSNGSDWLETAKKAYLDLSCRYRSVHLVGHSMGGAIALVVAREFSARRLVLLAPALTLAAPAWKARWLRFFVRRLKTPWHHDPSYSLYCEGGADDDLFLGHEYWSYIYPKAVWELEKLRRKALASIDGLSSDTLVELGTEDASVLPDGCRRVAEKPLGTNRLLMIEGGTHLLPYDKNLQVQDFAMQGVVDWLVG